ncbi:hypothetical protein DER46DRAFT_574177 [Fusarium sp. MPI-SDFR-AT-0072]|nr:hypothetical protein DER46DRAFT_574177 [Fusarium sp. MPI-SDFR-AT-0072]
MRDVSQNAEEVPSAKPSLQSSDMYRQVASFAGGQTSRTSRQGPIEGWIESDRTGSQVLVRRQVSESDATATRYLGPAQLQGREDQRRRLRSRQPRGGEERTRMCGVCSKEDEGNNQGQEITKIINQTKKAEGKVDCVGKTTKGGRKQSAGHTGRTGRDGTRLVSFLGKIDNQRGNETADGRWRMAVEERTVTPGEGYPRPREDKVEVKVRTQR